MKVEGFAIKLCTECLYCSCNRDEPKVTDLNCRHPLLSTMPTDGERFDLAIESARFTDGCGVEGKLWRPTEITYNMVIAP